jgi:hypothetical protein
VGSLLRFVNILQIVVVRMQLAFDVAHFMAAGRWFLN